MDACPLLITSIVAVKPEDQGTFFQDFLGLSGYLCSIGGFYSNTALLRTRNAQNHNEAIAVGQPVARLPPHRLVLSLAEASRRAELPHRALASGRDAQALLGPGVVDAGHREPVSRPAVHPSPTGVGLVAATRERAIPQDDELIAEGSQSTMVVGHVVVVRVPAQHAAQPAADLGDGVVHAPCKLRFDLA